MALSALNAQHPMPINMLRDNLAEVFSYLSIEDLKLARIACKAFKEVAENNFSHWIANQYAPSFVQKFGGQNALTMLPFAGVLKQHGERSTVAAAKELYALIERETPLAMRALYRICIQNPLISSDVQTSLHTVRSIEALIYRDQIVYQGTEDGFGNLAKRLSANINHWHPSNPVASGLGTSMEEKQLVIQGLQTLGKKNKEKMHDCLCILKPKSQLVEVNVFDIHSVDLQPDASKRINSMRISLSEEEEEQFIQETLSKQPLTLVRWHFSFSVFQTLNVPKNVQQAWVTFEGEGKSSPYTSQPRRDISAVAKSFFEEGEGQ